MCMTADNETEITINYSDELKEVDSNSENTWIITAQSKKQIDLLSEHKKSVPIFVDGPYNTWIRSKMVEYFIMRTDPLADTLEKMKKIQEMEEKEESSEDFKNMYNMFYI